MVQTIKDLEKILKLCRKQGVLEITTPEVSFKLGELPHKESTQDVESETDKYEDFPDEPLTNEELTFFANGGQHQDNPYRKN